MARLTDPELLAQFRKALSKRNGYIDWKKVPAEWVRRNLEGQTQRSIEAAMFDHVQLNGEIDQQPETRPEYRDRYEFHYDFRLYVDGSYIYIETTLDDIILPTVTIVSLHYV